MAGNPSLVRLGPLRGMSGGRRIALAGIATLAIAAIWWLGRWASEPTFVTLFSDLEFSQIAPIEEKLSKAGIRHKLGPTGSEILVPVTDGARARVALAKDGLVPQGRPGLELFDKPSWGMTDFTQRVTFQRAMEGELSRTIQEIRGVEKAQVHIVLPTPSPLRRLEKPASASVVLTMAAAGALPPEAVRGITYIVSNSVEGLSADNVVIMDSQGRLLSIPSSGGSGAGVASWQNEAQRSVEDGLAGKIEELLVTMLGVGNVRAQVTAEMSFDQVDRTIESYDPDGQVLSSEQRSESSAGTDGGVSPAVVISNAYQNSRRLERSVSGAGKINRLTAAVLVDQAAFAAALPGEDAAAATARLESMVRDAIGADAARGDRVSVLTVPFERAAPPAGTTDTPPAKPPLDLMMLMERVGRPVAGALAIVALLFLGLRLLRMVPASERGLREGAAAGTAKAASPATLPPSGNRELAALTSRLGADAQDRSELAAQVMRNWLAEKP